LCWPWLTQTEPLLLLTTGGPVTGFFNLWGGPNTGTLSPNKKTNKHFTEHREPHRFLPVWAHTGTPPFFQKRPVWGAFTPTGLPFWGWGPLGLVGARVPGPSFQLSFGEGPSHIPFPSPGFWGLGLFQAPPTPRPGARQFQGVGHRQGAFFLPHRGRLGCFHHRLVWFLDLLAFGQGLFGVFTHSGQAFQGSTPHQAIQARPLGPSHRVPGGPWGHTSFTQALGPPQGLGPAFPFGHFGGWGTFPPFPFLGGPLRFGLWLAPSGCFRGLVGIGFFFPIGWFSPLGLGPLFLGRAFLAFSTSWFPTVFTGLGVLCFFPNKA